MKAIVYSKYGSPDVLSEKNLPKPEINADEILVKVHAATVNRTDCAMLLAKPFIMRLMVGLLKPKRMTLGTDFAGDVVEVGSDVRAFSKGDRIFGFDDLGVSSHAQYLKIRAKNAITKIPEGVSFEDAAASIEGAHYAYNMINKVPFKKGDHVMVYGASGAIGSALVQLIHHFGGSVTAVCGTKTMEAIKSLKPDRIVDYQTEDFTKVEKQFDYVFDAVGKITFGQCKHLLKSKGVYISSELGPGGQNIFLSLFTPMLSRKKVKFPFPVNRQKSVDLMSELLQSKAFKPLIDKVYTLDQCADAFRYVLTGQKVGNVVLIID